MEQSDQSKKVLLSIIGIAILVVAVVGVSFAFFNYTRTSNMNSVQTGKINFSSGYGSNAGDDTISITNFFPLADGATPDSSNSDSMVITISGGTTYSAGLDYRIVAVGMTGTQVANVPVQVSVSQTGLSSGGNTFVALPQGNGSPSASPVTVSNGLVLGEGHIAASSPYSLTNGTVTITASIPATVAISDTYDNGATPGSTTSQWVNGRTVITTAQWNSLATNPITFKVRVESKQTGGNYAYSPS